jgi:hypothetical protein
MTVDQLIVSTLQTPTGLEVEESAYTGTDSEYITFDYYTRPISHYDNAPENEIYHVSVHLVAPPRTPLATIRRQIKTLMFAAGFTWPEETNASSDAEKHYVYECEYIAASGV